MWVFSPPVHILSSYAMFRSSFRILSAENEVCQACFHSVACLDHSRGMGQEEAPYPAQQAKSQPHDCLHSLRKICCMEKNPKPLSCFTKLIFWQYSKHEGSTNHLSNVLSGHCLSSERTQELYVASSSSVLQSTCA